MTRIVDPIYGYIPLMEHERAIIDTYIFQRLRYIHQSGTAYLTYPASNHTRFQHSIGVMHIASSAFEGMWSRHKDFRALYDEKYPYQLLRDMIRLVGLTHDIGHGPFSHASEMIVGRIIKSSRAHEDILLKLLTDEEHKTNLSLLLEKTMNIEGVVHADRLIQNLGKFFSNKESNDLEIGTKIIPYQHFFKKLMDGETDVDNMDYLIRDTYVTGVPMSWLEIESIIASLVYIDDEPSTITGKSDFDTVLSDLEKETGLVLEKDLVFDRRAISGLESFVLARRKLYKWLNFHHFVCLTDELFYRMMRLGIACEIFKPTDFGMEPFWNLIEADMRELEGKDSIKTPKTIDDIFITDRIKSALAGEIEYRDVVDDIENRNCIEKISEYWQVTMRKKNYEALWKVSLEKLSSEDISVILRAWKRIKEIRISDMHKDENKYDILISELERDLRLTARNEHDINIPNPDFIIAFKPYPSIKLQFNPLVRTSERPLKIKPLDDVYNIVKWLKGGTGVPPLEDPALYVYAKMPPNGEEKKAELRQKLQSYAIEILKTI